MVEVVIMFILVLPLNATPLMFRAVVSVAADPVVFWFRVATLAAATVPDDILLAFKVVSPEPSPEMDPLTFTCRGLPVSMAILDCDALPCVYPISSLDADSSYIMATLLLPLGRVITSPRSTIAVVLLSLPISMIGSLIRNLSVSMVVDVPSTVRLPVMIASPEAVRLETLAAFEPNRAP
jgi:hypothetical protein